MTIAVTGATGYLGSHTLLSLTDRGQDAIAFADEGDLPDALSGQVDLVRPADREGVSFGEALGDRGVTSVIHFLEEGHIPDSVIDPLSAYDYVLTKTLTVLRAATEAKVRSFVFSSTASVYGVPERMPIKEDTPQRSISPAGAAMSMAERLVVDIARPAGMATGILRYFNVAGADPKLRAGERGHPRHLVKAAARIATGILDEPLKIYGDDYDTPDGTPVRDYIHVSDMAAAHVDCLAHLERQRLPLQLNCGYGRGISVRDVISSVERICGHRLETVVAPRRPGDPPVLIADTAAIRTTLPWAPRFDDLDVIVRTAVEWERKTAKEAA